MPQLHSGAEGMIQRQFNGTSQGVTTAPPPGDSDEEKQVGLFPTSSCTYFTI